LRPARRVLLRGAFGQVGSDMEVAVRREKEEMIEEVEGAGCPHSLHSKGQEIGGRGSSALTPRKGWSRGCGSSSLLSGKDRKAEGAVRPHSLLRIGKVDEGKGKSQLETNTTR